MGVPFNYRKSSEPAIASYDYVDTIDSLGYVDYYANQGTENKLTRNPITSQEPVEQVTSSATSATLVSDKHWDLDFNMPAIIAGAPIYVAASADNAQTNAEAYNRMDVVVSKITTQSGAEILASVSGALVTIAAEQTLSSRMMTKVDIPKTGMKAGEKLRINTRMYAWHAAGSSPTITYWYDGAGRGTTAYEQVNPDNTAASLGYKNRTDLIVTIPFDIDL